MTLLRRRSRKGHKGFTLIEMMVVVAILGVLVAILVPAVLRIVAKRRARGPTAMNKAVAVAQESLKVQQIIKTKRGVKLKPSLLHAVTASAVKVDLKVNYLLDRGKVVPVYEARYEGRYVLQNRTRRPLSMRVYFPFPAGAGTFSDLKFLVSPPGVSQRGKRSQPGAPTKPGPASRPASKPNHRPAPRRATPPVRQPAPRPMIQGVGLVAPRYDVRISTKGVSWRRHFAAGEQVKVLIRYRVRGRDRYRYRIAPGKKRRFRFALSVAGVDPRIPPHALKPSASHRMLRQEGRTYVWDFRDFLTTEDIEIRFPLEYSKYYRFALLGKLATLSLLLFAFFFWFFGERQHPDKITRPNFALLNLGFVSFYPMFIYLDDHIRMSVAMVIALATSAILTTAHTTTFMGFRWALTRSLPLQLFFVIGFTFAVLFPTYRPLTFTIGGVILTALVIAIHARYQKERERQEQARKEAEEEEQLRQTKRREARKRDPEVAELTPASDSVGGGDPLVDSFFGDDSASATVPSQGESHQRIPESPGLESSAPEPERCHCLFCGAVVSPEHKHCFDCGELLHRTHACSGCDFVYWYPSVESFRFCRQCGTGLYPPASPLPRKGAKARYEPDGETG